MVITMVPVGLSIVCAQNQPIDLCCPTFTTSSEFDHKAPTATTTINLSRNAKHLDTPHQASLGTSPLPTSSQKCSVHATAITIIGHVRIQQIGFHLVVY